MIWVEYFLYIYTSRSLESNEKNKSKGVAECREILLTSFNELNKIHEYFLCFVFSNIKTKYCTNL